MSVLWSESVSTWMRVGVQSFWLPLFKLNISTNAAHGIVRMKAADYIQILLILDSDELSCETKSLCSRWGCNGHVMLCFLQMALYTNIVHSGVPFFVMRLIRYVI